MFFLPCFQDESGSSVCHIGIDVSRYKFSWRVTNQQGNNCKSQFQNWIWIEFELDFFHQFNSNNINNVSRFTRMQMLRNIVSVFQSLEQSSTRRLKLMKTNKQNCLKFQPTTTLKSLISCLTSKWYVLFLLRQNKGRKPVTEFGSFYLGRHTTLFQRKETLRNDSSNGCEGLCTSSC